MPTGEARSVDEHATSVRRFLHTEHLTSTEARRTRHSVLVIASYVMTTFVSAYAVYGAISDTVTAYVPMLMWLASVMVAVYTKRVNSFEEQ